MAISGRAVPMARQRGQGLTRLQESISAVCVSAGPSLLLFHVNPTQARVYVLFLHET